MFGWVATNINSNCYQWSTHKGIGSETEATAFYNETRDEYADRSGMEWFCYPVEEQQENN